MTEFGFRMDAPPPKRHRPWPLIAGVLAFVVVAAVVVAKFIAPPADFSGTGKGTVMVTIVSGDSLSRIGRRLKDAGVVASVDAWVAVTKNDDRANSIAPGDYNLRKEMSARSAMELLLSPESRAINKLVVREGERVLDIITAASKLTGIAKDDFVEVLKHPGSYGLPSIADGRPEGYLFPATYEIAKDATALEVLSMMTARWKQASASLELKRRAAKVGHTVDEIMTIASILEVEAGPDDYAKVARVIENRLKKPMRLQLDSTVNYALGISKLQLTASQMQTPSAFNTYTNDGLPPGPIGNPGEAAIEAALEPAKGPWLYFVTVDPATKTTKFATTYEEFMKLKREFQNNVA